MQTLQPINDLYSVPDGRNTEFEVQAGLFQALRNKGVDVRGEVRWFDKATRVHCRFDLVIYEKGKAAHILEVKAAPVKHRNGVENTRQGRRYRMFGVPVTFVYGSMDAERFVDYYCGGS